MRVAAIGALVRRDRWAYSVGWPYGTHLRPGWVMYAGGRRWTKAEVDAAREHGARLAAELQEFVE